MIKHFKVFTHHMSWFKAIKLYEGLLWRLCTLLLIILEWWTCLIEKPSTEFVQNTNVIKLSACWNVALVVAEGTQKPIIPVEPTKHSSLCLETNGCVLQRGWVELSTTLNLPNKIKTETRSIILFYVKIGSNWVSRGFLCLLNFRRNMPLIMLQEFHDVNHEKP